MSYTISKTENPSVWQVVFEGRIDGQERRAAIEEGLKTTADQEMAGILVDLSAAQVSMWTLETFELGERVASQPQFRGVRIAFLHSPGEERDSHFLETVESNRGMWTSIFVDRDEAMCWLSAGRPDE